MQYYKPYSTTSEMRSERVSILELLRRKYNSEREPNAAVIWNRSFPEKDEYIETRDTKFFTGINNKIYIIDTIFQEPDKKEYYRFQYNKDTYICYEFIVIDGLKINYINYFMSSLASGRGALMLYDFLTYLTQVNFSNTVMLTPDPNLHKDAPFDKLKQYYLSLGFTTENSIDYIADIATIQSNILAKFSAEKGGRKRKTNKRKKSNKNKKSNKKTSKKRRNYRK